MSMNKSLRLVHSVYELLFLLTSFVLHTQMYKIVKTSIQNKKKNAQRKPFVRRPALSKPIKMNKIRNAPSAKSYSTRTAPPRITTRDTSVTLSHREYLTPVVGSGAFTVKPFILNAGLSDSFPWLSAIASRYEYYHIKKIRLEYVPLCGTATVGVVGMAFDTDVSDPDPSDFRTMTSYAGFQSKVPWDGFSMAATADQLMTGKKYVRADNPTVGDRRLFDWGKALIVVESASDGKLGDVYVSYTVTLTVPDLRVPAQAKSTGLAGKAASSVVGPSDPLPMVYNTTYSSLLGPIAKAVGSGGKSLIGDINFTDVVGNLQAASKFIPVPAGVTDDSLATLNNILALVLPTGKYRFDIDVRYGCKRATGTGSFVYAVEGHQDTFGVSPAFLLDGAWSSSRYSDIIIGAASDTLGGAFTTGTTTGGNTLISPVITTGAFETFNFRISFTCVFNELYPFTAPCISLDQTINSGFTISSASAYAFEITEIPE